jgi:6-phosphogluconolactonase
VISRCEWGRGRSEGKAEMSAVVLEQAPTDGSIPAALVTGNVYWVMDAAAASKLTR